jgi:hypothetical protein
VLVEKKKNNAPFWLMKNGLLHHFIMKESSQSGEPEGNSTEGNTIININIQKENYVLTRCTHERTNTTLTILDTLQKEKK